MSKVWLKNVATEAIEHQGRSNLFVALTDLIDELRRSGEYTDSNAARLGLSSKIEDLTGIATRVNIVKSTLYNAAVSVPQLDKNHPLIANILRATATSSDLDAAKKFSGGKFTGTVDKKTSHVFGDFTKLICPLYITTKMLEDDYFTSAELASVILHELGHIFSYFERLVDLVSANLSMVTAVEKMFKLENDVERVEVLAEFDKYNGITLPDKETIATSNSKGVVYTHVACEVMKQRRNVEGEEIYSYRGFEFSADQFATRHGAGADLVKALDKLERKIWLNPAYASWPLHIMSELVRVTFYMVTAYVTMKSNPFMMLPIIGMLLAARPMDKIYDDPADRFKRIEQEMISELKNRQLAEGRRNEVIGDLEMVRELTEHVEDKRQVWEVIWSYVIPAGNASRKRTEFQKELENLSNNELYIASAMFK